MIINWLSLKWIVENRLYPYQTTAAATTQQLTQLQPITAQHKNKTIPFTYDRDD